VTAHRPVSPISGSKSESLGRIWRLCLKELRESLRDRRTLATLVLMPLIVYPILSITFQRFLLTTANSSEPTVALIGVVREGEMDLLQSLLSSPKDAGPNGNRSGPLALPEDFTLRMTLVDDLELAVRKGDIDLGVELTKRPHDSSDRVQQSIGCRLIHNENAYRGKIIAEWIESRLKTINEEYMAARLRELGESGQLPAEVTRERITVENNTAQSLATLIPLVLILMTVTGAVYPAIDLTAGERERGTMEALISAPIPRLGLLFAKYVAVMTVALLTATANLVAMTVTLYSTGLTEAIFGRKGLPISTMAIVFGLMVLFASFFSAILLGVTSFARSFKEAQAYIVPIILFSLAPCLACLAPGIEINGMLAVAPLVNIVLLARDVFTEQVNWQLFPLVVISTGMYASAAISIAARVFGSDAILYGSQTGIRELFLGPGENRNVPSLSGATMFLAFLFPLYVLLVNGLAVWSEAGIGMRLIMSSAVTIFLFMLLPWLVAFLIGLRLESTFQLRRCSFRALLGAALLGISLWPMMHELVVMSHMGALIDNTDKFELVAQFVKALQQLSPWFVLMIIAVVPAVCEEFFFRGFLLSALLDRLTARQAILLSAVLFGLFHVIAKSALAVERMLPSTIIGIVLGWVCWRWRSLWPGIVLHALHNGILAMIVYHQDSLEASGWDVQGETHLPFWLLGVGVVGAVLGWWLVRGQNGDRSSY
jgi:sodium transport system permease protein